MTRRVFAGALYGDAWPSEEYVVLFANSHLETHRGIVAFPPGELFGVLYPVLTNVGGFRFVGQGHDVLSNFEWDGEWHPRPVSNGTYGHIYDANGQLYTISPGPGVTSQGYRYVAADGRLVSGDETYGPFHGLSQWTDVGDGLFIGQGHDDAVAGVVVWDGVTLRRLDTGLCWPVRAKRQGDAVTVTYTRAGEGVIIRQATMQELRELSIVTVAQPKPEPPKEEPKPVEIPNYFKHVEAVWSRVGGSRDEDAAKVTRVAAFEIFHGINGAPKDPRVGLWQKRSASTINDRDPDKLVFNLGHNQVVFVDIVAGAGAQGAHAAWQPTEVFEGGPAGCPDAVRCQGWVEPVAEGGGEEPKPEEPKPLPTTDLSEVWAEIFKLKAALDAANEGVVQFANLTSRVRTLENKKYHVKGRTERRQFMGSFAFEANVEEGELPPQGE